MFCSPGWHGWGVPWLGPVLWLLLLVGLGWMIYGLFGRLRGGTEAEARCPRCAGGVRAVYFRCPHCGETLKHHCPGCSRVVETTWAFCPYCRDSLAMEKPSTQEGDGS